MVWLILSELRMEVVFYLQQANSERAAGRTE
jgi:hypothetical protein